MSVLFVLLLASLLVALGFLGAFLWAVHAGQFDDTLTPSWRILSDDDGNVSRKKDTRKPGPRHGAGQEISRGHGKEQNT